MVAASLCGGSHAVLQALQLLPTPQHKILWFRIKQISKMDGWTLRWRRSLSLYIGDDDVSFLTCYLEIVRIY